MVGLGELDPAPPHAVRPKIANPAITSKLRCRFIWYWALWCRRCPGSEHPRFRLGILVYSEISRGRKITVTRPDEKSNHPCGPTFCFFQCRKWLHIRWKECRLARIEITEKMQLFAGPCQECGLARKDWPPVASCRFSVLSWFADSRHVLPSHHSVTAALSSWPARA